MAEDKIVVPPFAFEEMEQLRDWIQGHENDLAIGLTLEGTTYDELDKDRAQVLEMEKELLGSYLPHEKDALQRQIDDFEKYIENKEKDCSEFRNQGKKINPEFIFSEMKLDAIEKTIVKELGRKGLEEIKSLYEKEMVERILKSTETH